MPDIINLLPDSVANQIAAGEVVQRPASAVKELLENAIDAKSTSIKLIVKDAGKTLIQVIDNGIGMSETDARMCFERHATSKIKNTEDLFSIRTMGFRGEAMASIAAIAQVEMKTRKQNDETGTQIEIEGSEVKNHSSCQCPVGTSISVKNLFYNVPARRNFLKSDNVELRHIIEEFERVAIAHPEISFSMFHNNNEVFNLPSSALRQRIINLYGNPYNQRLVPVEEKTNLVNISGFVIKPEFSKKTRGEQFFFVNTRFIKSSYLHHAVQMAFEQLLPNDSYPSYFLMLELDPRMIDINIHPTKTEIKFEDEKSIYAILRSAVKKSLGQYNIAPSLDFEQETSLSFLPPSKDKIISQPTIKVNPDYNPFKEEKNYQPQKRSTPKYDWTDLISDSPKAQNTFTETKKGEQIPLHSESKEDKQETSAKAFTQFNNRYIVAPIKSGLMIIDQQAAHERILYERYLKSFEQQKSSSQRLLFPQTIDFNASDAELVKELRNDICSLGFDINEFGKNTFVIQGIPTGTENNDTNKLLEKLIEHYKQNQIEVKINKHENLARSMANEMAIKAGKALSDAEMKNIIDELFACEMPYNSPTGKSTLITLAADEIEKKFKK